MTVFGTYPLPVAALAVAVLVAGCEEVQRPAPRRPAMDVSIVVELEIFDAEVEDAPILAKAPEGSPPAMETPDFGDRDRVFFAFDKSAVQDDQRAMLREWGDWLATHPDWGLRIEGHTDEQGSCLYNRWLGQQRANASRDLLVAQGIDPSRLRAVSFGEDRPVIPGASRAQRTKNRRVRAEPMRLADMEAYDPDLSPCTGTQPATSSTSLS